MIRIWSQLISMIVLVSLAGGTITGAYFHDTERSPFNMFGAFELDAAVLGAGITGDVCSVGGTKETLFNFENVGGLQFEYSVAAVVTVNENGLCDLATLTALRDDVLVYEGSIAGFSGGTFVLPPGEHDEWRVGVTFPASSTSTPVEGSCAFDTVFLANQETFMSGQAFFDTELNTHSILGTAGSCMPATTTETVDLYLNKHISGDDQGYELSDFLYRVVGNDVDQIVPHDHTIALPIGEYTIEEIVPEGFVKDDWRIGWYGQCEAGSTFMTSITIDEGNIDHGTLYCEADNQYRPGHGDNQTEEIEDPPEDNEPEIVLIATTSTQTTEEERAPRSSRDRRARSAAGEETENEAPVVVLIATTSSATTSAQMQDVEVTTESEQGSELETEVTAPDETEDTETAEEQAAEELLESSESEDTETKENEQTEAVSEEVLVAPPPEEENEVVVEETPDVVPETPDALTEE